MPRTTILPLWVRIFLLAMLNLALLVGIFAIFLQSQLKSDLESFLMAEARERIKTVTTEVASDLQQTDPAGWDALLKKYSEENGITLLLYRNTGEQLSGPVTALPAEVNARMPRGGGGPPRGGGNNRGGRGPQAGDRGDPGPRRGSTQGPSGQTPDRPFLVVTTSSPKYWVGNRMPVIDRTGQPPLFSVLMLVSRSFFMNSFYFEVRPWLAMGAVALCISALCWLPLVRNLTHSIADMMRATGRIADGRFDVQIKVRRKDELGQLGASITQMAGRLEMLTEGRKRFLGAVAHELRSPIARMRLATEIMERNAGQSGKYSDNLKQDLETMTRLTDELLQLARAESAPILVKVQPTRLAEAVETAVRQESAEGTDILIDVDPAIEAMANKDDLVRALANLLRNAVRYAGGQGPVSITAVRQKDEVLLTVSDCGPGVPDEDIEKIFAPFYRVDDARDRRTGGTGLGLAIVRSCIEGCGGKVSCRKREPTGLEFLISLKSV